MKQAKFSVWVTYRLLVVLNAHLLITNFMLEYISAMLPKKYHTQGNVNHDA